MRFVVMFLLVAYVCSPGLAHAGWFDFLFPTPAEQGPNPSETLRAPFADQDAVIEDLDESGQSKQVTPLHLRHRTNTAITMWVQHILPSLLTYKADKYNQEYSQKIRHFNKNGSSEYVKFLNEENFLTTLKSGQYDITGFVQDYPVVLNEGAIEGRYRWLYQTTVMVTYLKHGTSDYKVIEEGDTVTRTYVLTVQLGRSDGANNEHGLLIDTWSVKEKK